MLPHKWFTIILFITFWSQRKEIFFTEMGNILSFPVIQWTANNSCHEFSIKNCKEKKINKCKSLAIIDQ